MSAPSTHAIWHADTGIQDLEHADAFALGASEIDGIRAVWTQQRERLSGSEQLFQFTERMNCEWAIETGIIENLYDIERGVAQTLIERGFQADLLGHGSTDKPRQFVLNLLRDQKEALDGLFDFVRSERSLSVSYIKELHAALLRSQESTEAMDAQGRIVVVPLIKGVWKTQPNYPVRDGITYLYCPPEHVAAEMDRLVDLHAEHINAGWPPDVRAAWLHHRFTQIHPFQDGNGRVARAIASLVLIKDGLFPMVVTRDEKPVYLDALEAADDGRLDALVALIVKLQITQFRKASAISELVLAEDGVAAGLERLRRSADSAAAERSAALEGVFDVSRQVEDAIEQKLSEIPPDVSDALSWVSPGGRAWIDRSNADTDHYYRAQILEMAETHIGYFADTAEYRSWVAMKMRWSRRAQLVFPIHGISRPFTGSLICSPFLEFKDTDADAETTPTLIPLSSEGFIFFHNEDANRLLARLRPWLEDTLKVDLNELSQNL